MYLLFGKNYKIEIAIVSKSYSDLTATCNRTDRLQEAGSRKQATSTLLCKHFSLLSKFFLSDVSPCFPMSHLNSRLFINEL